MPQIQTDATGKSMIKKISAKRNVCKWELNATFSEYSVDCRRHVHVSCTWTLLIHKLEININYIHTHTYIRIHTHRNSKGTSREQVNIFATSGICLTMVHPERILEEDGGFLLARETKRNETTLSLDSERDLWNRYSLYSIL